MKRIPDFAINFKHFTSREKNPDFYKGLFLKKKQLCKTFAHSSTCLQITFSFFFALLL